MSQVGSEPRPGFYRALVESVLGEIVVVRSDGAVRWASPTVERVAGYAPEELVGATADGHVHPEDLEAVEAALAGISRRAAASGLVARFRHKDGSWRRVEGIAVDLLDDPGVRGIVLNVWETGTGEGAPARDLERRVAERTAELEENARKYRSIFDNCVEGILQTSADGRLLTANPAMARIFGYESPEELLRSVPDIRRLYADPADREELAGHVRKDGAAVWVSASVRAIHGADGKFAGFEGTLEDIAGRKRAEARVRESEERFRHTFELAGLGMAQVRLDGGWIAFDDELLRIVDYDRNELSSSTFRDVTHPEDRDADAQAARRLLAGNIRAYSVQKRLIRQDGARIWAGLTVSLTQSLEGPDYLIYIVEDITEPKLAELVPNPLTPRELETLRLMARNTNRRISQDLKHSMATAKRDVRLVLAKLGVADRREAEKKAVEIGLVPPPLPERKLPPG